MWHVNRNTTVSHNADFDKFLAVYVILSIVSSNSANPGRSKNTRPLTIPAQSCSGGYIRKR